MKLNNKGFAISTVLYLILIIAVVLITLTLTLFSNRKLILDKIKKETLNTLYGDTLSYNDVLKQLRLDAIDTLGTSGTLEITDSSTSIDSEYLNKYNLIGKYLKVENNNVYLQGQENYIPLPDNYKLLEYIAGTGTQYIDTGIYAEQNCGVRMVANIDFAKDNAEKMLLGGSNLYIDIIADTYRFYLLYGSASGIQKSGYVTGNYIIDINYLNDGIIKINNSDVLKTGISQAITTKGTNSLYLFAHHTNTGAKLFTNLKHKIKEFKYTIGNQVKNDFIPCKNHDGAVGMYDLVGKKFYENSGTGSFTAGSEMDNSRVLINP